MGLKDFYECRTNLAQIKITKLNLVMAFSQPYLLDAKASNYALASQDITSLIDETVTGEITGSQLKELGVSYVLVGHSERRLYKKEINIDFINKITEATTHDLEVIYCIGETLKEKENDETEHVLKQQLMEVLNNVSLDHIMIAYEPVWAIGTGKTPEAKEIEETIAYIKELLRTTYDLNFKVLYGGSVDAENIASLVQIPQVDGFLVGGASHNIDTRQTIITNMEQN